MAFTCFFVSDVATDGWEPTFPMDRTRIGQYPSDVRRPQLSSGFPLTVKGLLLSGTPEHVSGVGWSVGMVKQRCCGTCRVCAFSLAPRLSDAACCLCESVYTLVFVYIWKSVGGSHRGFATQPGLWQSKWNSFLFYCLQEGLCTAHLPWALATCFTVCCTASDCLCAFSLFSLFLYFSWIIRCLFNTLARHYSWILWFFSAHALPSIRFCNLSASANQTQTPGVLTLAQEQQKRMYFSSVFTINRLTAWGICSHVR